MSIESDELIHYCDESGFDSLSIANRHIQTLETPKRPKDAPTHNDSFDRIILTQAKADGLFHNMRLANAVLRQALHSGCLRVIQKELRLTTRIQFTPTNTSLRSLRSLKVISNKRW